MPRTRPRKSASKSPLEEEISRSESGIRQDLPDRASIIGDKEFISPKGNKYRIILTNETDPYDKPENDLDKCNKEK